jgi:hypothetical protein
MMIIVVITASHLGLEMVGWIDDEWGNHSRLPPSTLTGFFLII